ncbi:TPA: DUF4366 domain-containing protein [Streptococcus equi subsp. zooepidemicus]|nr:DUF4366 domain-containing protein [Streptococcus equi subsp. zooepidemicus]HEL0011302.1 DUF4366 domain-containing protein [Streptococcus equi subsp. zooepidemicus]HEL0013372.1 DUF4366 domain-containing protein [Streptococcus equi subsp. zooepidemicus]HEL0017480.1 DUF4366 domain-containing protein [Streptococcus equi subsp. zooepidemicus]HEL0029336.1 DUF4366 domain-containing protein [Streptococcus equi subsp. zooepidemicus]
MKNLKNRKFVRNFIGITLLITVIAITSFASSKIVFAQGNMLPAFISPTEVFAKEKVEINLKYIFEDEKVFKEEKIEAIKGEKLDSGDLPMLPDDMKFIDDFLFYEVKGDGEDEIIRKVEKITQKDERVETEDEVKNPEENKPEELSKDQKSCKELEEKLDKLEQELKSKELLSDENKGTIKEFETEIKDLKEKVKKGEENKDVATDMRQEMNKLSNMVKEFEDKVDKVKNAPVAANFSSPVSPVSALKTSSGILPQATTQTPKIPANNTSKDTLVKTNSENTSKDTSNTETKEKEVRYPNKLTPKASTNNNQTSQVDSSNKNVNTNKGIASTPSKARASVAENKDNANKDYPVHHNDDRDNKQTDKYSADARQFVTFQTKNGKTFHLIINHDESSENVMLLTEVSEDDLLNMVEKKETPKPEVTKDVPVKEEKPVKKEEKNNTGMYVILVLVVAGALGAGYYFKVIKKKEDKELEAFEEEDDDFFSEAESNTENEEDKE